MGSKGISRQDEQQRNMCAHTSKNVKNANQTVSLLALRKKKDNNNCSMLTTRKHWIPGTAHPGLAIGLCRGHRRSTQRHKHFYCQQINIKNYSITPGSILANSLEECLHNKKISTKFMIFFR